MVSKRETQSISTYGKAMPGILNLYGPTEWSVILIWNPKWKSFDSDIGVSSEGYVWNVMKAMSRTRIMDGFRSYGAIKY